MNREALKLALEALEDLGMKHYESTGEVLYKETFAAIKEALAQPEHGWTPERIAGMARLKEAQDKKLAQPEHDYKDLYEKEKRHSAMWLAKYEEVAGPVPYAVPVAQPEQTPVGWYDSISGQMDHTFYKPHRKPSSPSAEWIPVYTTPPQRKPLTDEEVRKHLAIAKSHEQTWLMFARAIEAAHGIKGEA